jgi:hypothetical protein
MPAADARSRNIMGAEAPANTSSSRLPTSMD